MDPAPSMIGLVPAAGLATRLGALPFAKELLPAPGPTGPPRPVIEFSLCQLREAGVDRALVVLRPGKFGVAEFLGDGQRFGLGIGYAVQRGTDRGLVGAVRSASAWLAGRPVCLVLPDTVLQPCDAVARVVEAHREGLAELVLGVFPTRCPEQLGPVLVEGTGDRGTVREVLDKPAASPVANTWGAAAWDAGFTSRLMSWSARRLAAEPLHEPSLGAAFQSHVESRGSAAAVVFDGPRAAFADLGTVPGIAAAWSGSAISENDRPIIDRGLR